MPAARIPTLQTTLLNQPSAQTVDGSLKFAGGYLTRRPAADGNRTKWTYSCWVKFDENKAQAEPLLCAGDGSSDFTQVYTYKSLASDIALAAKTSSSDKVEITSLNLLRDAGWYHIVAAFDSTGAGYQTDTTIYVNGVEITRNTNTYAGGQNYEGWVNSTSEPHYLGRLWNGNTLKGEMSQVYLIDGMALGPGYFGYTDPLTNTWRPKKFEAKGTTVNNGTVWSSSLTASDNFASGLPATQAFDGSITTRAGNDNTNGGGNLTFTLNITGITNLEVLTGNKNTVTINGTVNIGTASVDPDWVEYDPGSTFNLNEIKITSNGQSGYRCDLYAIKIDGVMMLDSTTQNVGYGTCGCYLPMDGNTPIGLDQSGVKTVNDGTTWSSYITSSTNNFYGDGGFHAQGVGKGFDGDTSTYVQQIGGSNPNWITFTPPVGIPHTSLVEVWLVNAANEVSYNGGALQTLSSGSWQTVASGSGTLTSLKFERASTNGASFNAIRVDGTTLINDMIGNSWTPVNFGGSVSLDKATGALPILNTANDGKVATAGVRKDYGPNTAEIVKQSGCVAFDGTGDYLSMSDSADWNLGNTFTIEGYIYVTTDDTYNTIVSQASSGNNYYLSYAGSNNNLEWYNYNGAVTLNSATNSISLNTWHHIALVNNSGTGQFYIDGVASGSSSNAGTTADSSDDFRIGIQGSNHPFNGYISNLRVLKGTALYTSDFTPPTKSLTNIPNTKLLCCQSNTSAGAAAVAPLVSGVNNGTVWSTSLGGGSLFRSGYPAVDAFNGVTKTTTEDCAATPQVTGQGFTFTFGEGVPFTTLQMQCDHNNGGTITANGVDITSQLSSGSLTNTTITGVTSPLTSLRIYSHNGDAAYLGSVTIDGTMLVDPMTLNGDVYASDSEVSAKCVLALPLVGITTDVSTQINSGSTTKVVTVSGAAAEVEFANFYGPGGSYDFDGSNDKITIAPTNASDFTCQSDFTIEGWIYVDAFTTADAAIFSNWDVSGSAHRSLLIGPDASGNDDWVFMYNTTGAGGGWVTVANPDATPYLGKWTHIAYSYDHSTTTHRAFVDGVLVGTSAIGTAYNNSGANLLLGINAGDASGYFDGKMQDVRFYHTVKYTEDFIPASTNPDILPETPSGVALKSNLTTSTGGAVKFDGSGDYLVVKNRSDLVFEEGSFTIECFVYANSYNGNTYPTVISKYDNGDASWILRYKSDGDVVWYAGQVSGGTNNESTTQPIILNSWQHVAVVREGTGTNETKVYFDGQLVLTCSDDSDYDDTNNIYIGRQDSSNANEFDGYISNVRILKGTALYAANFTPPTAPLTFVNIPSIGSNDGKIWSSNGSFVIGHATHKLQKAFDGLTGANDYAMTANSNGDSEDLVVTLPGLASGKTVRFYGYRNTNAGTLTFNDGAVNLPTGSGNKAWVTAANTTNGSTDSFSMNVNVGSSISDDLAVFAVEVDGVVLVDGHTKLLCCQSTTSAGAADISPNINCKVNSGTQWSIGGGANFESSNPIQDAFNGDAADYTRTDNASVVATWISPKSIPWSSTLKIRGARDSGTDAKIIVNNVDVTSQFTANSATLETITISGVSSPLTRIDLVGVSGASQPRFSAIYIDDVMLVDPLTPFGNVKASTFAPSSTVRGPVTGYCTLNPLNAGNKLTLTNGNLTATGATGHACAGGTLYVSGGKWYWEGLMVTVSSTYSGVGMARDDYNIGSTLPGYESDKSFIMYSSAGKVYYNSATEVAYGTSWTTGDMIGCRYDEGYCYFYKNGVLVNTSPVSAPTVTSGRWTPVFHSLGDGQWEVNFGQKPFRYTPPEGHQPICNSNLLSTITNPLEDEIKTTAVFPRSDQYVGISTWTGDGTNNDRTIPSSCQPDLIWSKSANHTYDNNLFDSVRGFGANNAISTNDLAGQGFDTGGRIKSVDRTGITWENTSGDSAEWYNGSDKTYVSWYWRAGGNKNTFNVDDIGYASASDVNMSVGALNSSNYDTSQVWNAGNSGNNTTDPAMCFKGNLFTTGYGLGSQAFSDVSTHLTDKEFTVESEIALWAKDPATIGLEMEFNGITYTQPGGTVTYSDWTVFKVPPGKNRGTLKARLQSSSDEIRGVRVDGKILVNNGTTPPDMPTCANTGASVGTESGFSVIDLETPGSSTAGYSFAHGLGTDPGFVLAKQYEYAGNSHIYVWHKDLKANNYLLLTATNADNAGATAWANNKPDSNIFYDTANGHWGNSQKMIYYMWADRPGLQKFGIYDGNDNHDGTYVNLGFKPAIILFKNIDNSANWMIYDNVRDPYNQTYRCLYPNLTNAQNSTSTDNEIDILSNGFKLRNDQQQSNDSDAYVYAAWASQAVSNLYGAQSNAR